MKKASSLASTHLKSSTLNTTLSQQTSFQDQPQRNTDINSKSSPLKSSTDHMHMYAKHSAQTYSPLPIVLAKGLGSYAWDVEGRKYLDCIGGFGT